MERHTPFIKQLSPVEFLLGGVVFFHIIKFKPMKALKEPLQRESTSKVKSCRPEQSKTIKIGDKISYKVWHGSEIKSGFVTLIRFAGDYVDEIPSSEIKNQESLRGDYAIYVEGCKGDYIFYKQIIEICTE